MRLHDTSISIRLLQEIGARFSSDYFTGHGGHLNKRILLESNCICVIGIAWLKPTNSNVRSKQVGPIPNFNSVLLWQTHTQHGYFSGFQFD